MKTFVIATASTALMALGALNIGVKPVTATSVEFEQAEGNSLGSVSLDDPAPTNVGLLFNSLSTSTSQSTQAIDLQELLAPIVAQIPGLRVGTPGNDILIGETARDVILGRLGSDRFISVNSGAAMPGQGQIDLLIGGEINALFGNPTPSAAPNNNVFSLGDYNKAYYVSNTGNFGLEDFALIVDFNPSQDIIQLNGSPSNYTLATFRNPGLEQLGTALFVNNTQPDLIALLPLATDLSLDASYFQYLNTPPPQETQPGIRQFGSPGVDLSFGVAFDSAANVYATGITTDNLGGTNAGSLDVWLTKYDSNGQQQWIRQFGSSAADNAFANAVDSTDNVYIAGFTKGDLGGPNAGVSDAFLAKYDSNGNQQFIRQFGTEGLDNATNIAIDRNNNPLVAGFTTGSLGAPNAGSDDPYVAKFDSNGNLQWVTQFGTSDFDEAYGIALDTSSNIFLTGWTLGDLGGPNAGLYDAWLAKLDPTGNLLWTQQFGTPDYEFAWGVATDSFGSAYVSGWTLGDLGGPNAGLYDAFLAKYDTDGNQQWIKQFGTSASDQAFRLKIDSNDTIYVTGFTEGNLGGVNAGLEDAFYAKFDIDGNLLGINQFGTSQVDRGFGIDVKNTSEGDKVAVTGFTEGVLGKENKGSFDGFVGFFQKVLDHVGNLGGGSSGASCSNPLE